MPCKARILQIQSITHKTIENFALSVGDAEKVHQLAINYSKLLQIRNTDIIFLECYCDRLVRTKMKNTEVSNQLAHR